MRRLSLISVAAAVLVLSAGCSTAVTGAPEPRTSTDSPIATGTKSADTETAPTDATVPTDETATTNPTSEDPTGTSLVTTLDGSTELYFATFCISANELSQKLATLGDIDEADYQVEDLQSMYITTLTDAAGIAAKSVGVMEESPTPEFPESDQVQESVIERFTLLEAAHQRCGDH